ncbi:Uncharacterized protein AB751O23_AE_00060 [Chlamydiales bacterium SCGC AB-751-O23]|jgi:sulfite reductase (NADPH) flavoprotein alpha-component|nr:Uncharacterized protein AB751O23_AE_00060 [Chlamydiales bacterium SCGC AB-751-O23]
MLEKKNTPITHSLNQPFYCSIKKRFLLNKKGSVKKTFHLDLDLGEKDFHYEEGDSLGILSHNPPTLVAKTLNRLQLKGHETFFSEKKQNLISSLSWVMRANLQKLNRKILTFFETNCPKCLEEFDLRELLKEENKDKLKAFTETHHLIDLLFKNSNAAQAWAELFNLLSPLLPRFYSIASSPALYPKNIHLTVNKLEFSLHDTIRYGVCSHYLCKVALLNDPSIPVYLQAAKRFKLPQTPETPIIMIGPGTGIAPFRAFMQKRMTQEAKNNWLFFGECNEAFDFYYKEEWEEYQEKGYLQMNCAFSRDQEEKIYVQDKIYAQKDAIFEWIDQKKAHLYICGDAQKMAKAVEQTLEKILQEKASLSPQEARNYLKELRKDRRLEKDVY